MQMNRLTSSDFDKMIIESIDEVLAFDRDNDELLFMFDQIISGEITSENETIYAEDIHISQRERYLQSEPSEQV